MPKRCLFIQSIRYVCRVVTPSMPVFQTDARSKLNMITWMHVFACLTDRAAKGKGIPHTVYHTKPNVTFVAHLRFEHLIRFDKIHKVEHLTYTTVCSQPTGNRPACRLQRI